MTAPLRLFLLEADDHAARLVGEALERAGHAVTRCRSAADGLIVLGHEPFDLIVLDNRLADLKGVELLERLGREGIPTPAIFVTGAGDEELATRVLRAGALDYVAKDPAGRYLAELPRRAQEAVARHRLRQTNRLLVEALESARDGIVITDLNGTILHVNRALERMTGYAREELVGANVRLFKHEKTPREIFADLWRTILARASWQGELTSRRKDGSLVEVSLTVSPLFDAQGQLTHFVAIFRDIGERKFLERQLLQAQKMQSVGTLAGGVAHEFNNLLTGIGGYADLALKEAGLPEGARECLRQLVSLTERAASLTRQMLAFARKPTLVRRPTSLIELVQASAELVNRTLRAEVAIDVSNGLGDDAFLVDADANQLQQAVVNLVLNAHDALTEPAPITVRLRRVHLTGNRHAFPEDVPAGEYVCVEVIDRGTGMPPEVLNQALDPFFTTKPVGQGTGLGLPMVFGIVRGHHGYLSIETEPGRGTCVGIYLPPLAGPADARKPPAAFESARIVEADHGPGRHILVVDDEPAVVDVLKRFLELAGHRVTCAGSAKMAAELLAAGLAIDLAILDLDVPHDESREALRLLCERRPPVPVLLCTARELPEEVTGPVGANVLLKPFRMNELWYAVHQALQEPATG